MVLDWRYIYRQEDSMEFCNDFLLEQLEYHLPLLHFRVDDTIQVFFVHIVGFGGALELLGESFFILK
jgi:hypothetical protein